MATRSAIKFISGTKSAPLGSLQIQCRVKPGVSKAREGVTAVLDDAVEVCVSAPPVDGQSNRAIVKLISDVLNVQKSNVKIVRGLKSREKTIAVAPAPILEGTKGRTPSTDEEWVSSARNRLAEQAAENQSL